MCGRYEVVPNEETLAFFQAHFGVALPESPLYNLAPTEAVPVIFQDVSKNELALAKWWFTPSWSKDPDSMEYSMFNARAENLEASRAFKDSYHHKRCIIPATAFFEWKKLGERKQPFKLYSDKTPLLFAGIYDVWGGEMMSAAIVTAEASKAMSSIHHRMPVMLTVEQAQLWLNEKTPRARLENFFIPALSTPIYAVEVNPVMGNAKNKQATESIGEPMLLAD